MKHLLLIVPTVSLLFLAACIPVPPPSADSTDTDTSTEDVMEDEGMMKGEDGAMMKDEGMMKGEDGAMMKDEGMMKDDAMMTAGEYKDATASNLPAATLADGKTKVLFFHASWCPTCKTANQTLTSWYANGEGFLTVYKINYDEEKALKQKYGVTYQHTFVKVDGQGNVIEKIQGPSDDQLKKLLAS